MKIVEKLKSLLFDALTGPLTRTNYVYMANVINGQINSSIQYIKKAYQANADIYAIVSFIAGKCATVPFTLSEIVDEQALMKYKAMTLTHLPDSKIMRSLRTKALKQVDSHRILNMLNKAPNDYMTASEFKFGSVLYRLLTGNNYIRGFGPEATPLKFVELHLLPSHLTQPIGGGIYNKPSSYRLNFDPGNLIDSSLVSHSRYFNPDFEWPSNPHTVGQAPLQAAANITLQSNSGNEAMTTAFQNGGMAGVLYQEGGSDLSDIQREALQEHIDKKVTGSGNFKQILAASSKMGWLKIGESPVDLGIIEALNTTLRSLCNVFHVNSAIFNDPSNKSYNNISEARKAAITDAVLPELCAQRDQYNLWLVPGWEAADKKKYFVDFDATVFAELQANMKELAEWLNTAWWITPNQKLEQMDYEPQGPEYDQIFLPPGVAPYNPNAVPPVDPNASTNIDFNKAFNIVGDIDYKD